MLSGLTEEYKCTRVRLRINLADSQHAAVRAAALRLVTRRKWILAGAKKQTASALKRSHIVGRGQQGRGRFGLGMSCPTWDKVGTMEHGTMRSGDFTFQT